MSDNLPPLLPCPFCGATESVEIVPTNYPGEVRVICNFHRGGCGGSTGCGDTEVESVALWNRRAAIEANTLAVPDGWSPVTQELLDSQEPWLYKPCWLAIPSGGVLQGYYEWRQGRKPDRFYTNDGGDLWALDVLYVMPINPPASPSAAPQPQPVAQPVQAQPIIRMWHDRIKDEHPTSDPQYWPNALKVEYMEREILDLRAVIAQPKPANQQKE